MNSQENTVRNAALPLTKSCNMKPSDDTRAQNKAIKKTYQEALQIFIRIMYKMSKSWRKATGTTKQEAH